MKFFRLLSILVALAMVLSYGFQPAAQPAQAAPPQVDLTKVDPQVLNAFKAESSVGFFIIMTEQADVSAAAALQSKVEKTTYVYNLLRETADRTQKGVIRYLETQGSAYTSWYIMNMVSSEGSRQVVEALTAMPEVAKIVAAPQAYLDPVWRNLSTDLKMQTVQEAVAEQLGIEWNIARVHAPEVWAMGIQGDGFVVAGNDTGVDYTHPALVNKYRGNLGGGSFNHNYNWWGGAGSPSPVDGDGHGTHTMGTMVGDDGGANQIGVAPGAKWIACAGLGGSEPLECFQFFLAPWDLSHNNPDPTKAPDAINNSWYDPSGFDYRPIIQNLNAAGVAVIKSAGNVGPGCSTISNPGYVPEIIATAAFAQGDTIASFSSRGPMNNYGDTILKPEVAAPGVNVRSSVPGGGYEGGWDGTSMAAPHTTALVALLWNAAPCLAGDVPTTKQIMMDTAEPKIDAQCAPFTSHPNDVWGWGILDMQAAVQIAIGYCGGLGGIEGAVSSGGLPLQDVVVEATGVGGFSRSFTTGADGLYEMQVLSDTYTVTATKYGYEPGLATGIEVTADVTVTVDFDLPALPVFTVSGYVREAGSNLPLAASVEFTDAPVPPVNTDPATGFYSIEVAEGTWTLRAAAADHASQTFTIDVTGDLAQNFSLSPFCNVIEDDVEAGNLGWTAQAPWAIVTEASHSPTHSWTDSPGGAYQNYADTSLTSPVFDLSGYEGVALNFWHQYDTESGYDYADVEYSTNGGTTWTAAASYDGSQLAWTQQQIPLPEMDGQANARIRFHFTTDVSITGDGWHVDDIVLYGGGPACVPAASPTAEFSSNSPVLLGDPVVFINETSGSEPLTYEWDFGDDTGTSTDPNPTYTFADVGTYMVVLTATNDFGMDVVSHAVEVLPTPDISVTPPALAASQAPDTTSTQMLEICNVGGEPLDWSLAEAEAVAKGASLPSNKSTAKSAENIIKAPAPERNHDPLAIVLEEGFEGGVIPPAGWTLDVTNSNYTWEIQYGTPFEGVYAAEILYDPALVPQDEVLLSSELNITNGVLDFWSYGSVYWCRDTYNNCDLDVWIVVGDWDGGSVDDIYVGTADGDWPANWTWANSTFDLTPLLPGGPVRLAFQYSGVDGAEVSLDNIILDVAFDIPWMSETPISGTVAPGACTTVDVTFDSNGLAPGVYTANLVVTSNDPDTPEITVPVSLTVEETEFLLYLPIILKNP